MTRVALRARAEAARAGTQGGADPLVAGWPCNGP